MTNLPKLPSNRNFGIVFAIVFLIISLWPLLSQTEVRIWSLIVSIIFLTLGLINSKLLLPLNKIWFKFGIFLGNFIAPIVMGIIYFFDVIVYNCIIYKENLNYQSYGEKGYRNYICSKNSNWIFGKIPQKYSS